MKNISIQQTVVRPSRVFLVRGEQQNISRTAVVYHTVSNLHVTESTVEENDLIILLSVRPIELLFFACTEDLMHKFNFLVLRHDILIRNRLHLL